MPVAAISLPHISQNQALGATTVGLVGAGVGGFFIAKLKKDIKKLQAAGAAKDVKKLKRLRIKLAAAILGTILGGATAAAGGGYLARKIYKNRDAGLDGADTDDAPLDVNGGAALGNTEPPITWILTSQPVDGIDAIGRYLPKTFNVGQMDLDLTYGEYLDNEDRYKIAYDLQQERYVIELKRGSGRGKVSYGELPKKSGVNSTLALAEAATFDPFNSLCFILRGVDSQLLFKVAISFDFISSIVEDITENGTVLHNSPFITWQRILDLGSSDSVKVTLLEDENVPLYPVRECPFSFSGGRWASTTQTPITYNMQQDQFFKMINYALRVFRLRKHYESASARRNMFFNSDGIASNIDFASAGQVDSLQASGDALLLTYQRSLFRRVVHFSGRCVARFQPILGPLHSITPPAFLLRASQGDSRASAADGRYSPEWLWVDDDKNGSVAQLLNKAGVRVAQLPDGDEYLRKLVPAGPSTAPVE